MNGNQPAETENAISGGTFHGPVLQARTIHAAFQAVPAPTALAQLPRVSSGFTGRSDELALLAGLLDPAGAAGPVLVSALAGLAGVGKTTLAIAAAHAAIQNGWFPGGAVFIDLHGYDQAPVEPAQALDALLRGLGIPAEHIPPNTEQRAGLYRSVLAQAVGPMLVIADNASSEAQVQPLLPGTGPHAVLVTSRHTLAALGARLVDVTVLDQEASIALLDAVLRAARPGDDRITADPAAVGQLAKLCGGLPLALQISAALLTSDPTLTAADLADDLAAESERLDRLVYDDGRGTSALSVATAFGLSYRKLDGTAARVFRLLSVNSSPDISAAAAAALAGLHAAKTRMVLGALARAHLAETAPGTTGRWRMHDLVRLYAARLGDEHAEADGREQARDRLLDYYLQTATAAGAHLQARPGLAVPDTFTDRDNALAWLDAERTSLVAAPAMAASNGRDQVARLLPKILTEYLAWRRQFDVLLAITEISLYAARRLGDRRNEGDALNNLGSALAQVRRFDEAIIAHQDAAAIYRETRDRHREGMTLNNLGIAMQKVRRFDKAISAHQAAAAIYRETGDRHGEGMALNNLGIAMRQVGKFDKAISAHQDAAAIYRETGDRHSEGTALNNLGVALYQVREFDEAITACQDAAAIYRDTGDRHGEGGALNYLGLVLRKVHRFDEAITACQDAAAAFRDTGDRQSEGVALQNLDAVRAAAQA